MKLKKFNEFEINEMKSYDGIMEHSFSTEIGGSEYEVTMKINYRWDNLNVETTDYSITKVKKDGEIIRLTDDLQVELGIFIYDEVIPEVDNKLKQEWISRAENDADRYEQDYEDK